MAKIESVNDFLSEIADIHIQEERGKWVFRGHSNSDFELIASVGRAKKYPFDTHKEYEQHLFDMFCREAHYFLSDIPFNKLDWLSVAQHHGLPTRLLDFSYNPLVALFFAVELDINKDKDAEVIALKISDKANKDDDPFQINTPKKYYPNIVSPRIRAQEGLFIVIPEPEKELTKQLSKEKEKKFIIDKDFKEKIKYELFRLGIHKSSLYPDIDGLTDRIKYQNSVKPSDFF